MRFCEAVTSSAALRAGASRRPDPYRRQKARAFERSATASPVTGSRAALPASATTVYTLRSTMPPDWPTSRCWQTSSRPRPSAFCAVLWLGSTARAWNAGRSCRKRSGLPLTQLCQGLQGPGPQAHPHQALHAQDQWQGRAIWPPADCVYIQTLCREWAYGMSFQNSEERNRWLPRYLSIYNRLRKHTALGDRSPQQRLCELLC